MTKIRISLLPEELRKQSSAMKRWTILAMVLAIVAFVLLAGNILFSFYLNSPVAELESLKDQNKSMTENIGRLAYIQEMFDEIENNNRTIEGLIGNDPDWSHLMDVSAGDLTLYGINISRLEITALGESPGATVKGKTYDVTNITRWVENTELQDSLGDVSLGNITTGSGSGGKLEFYFDAVIGISKWNKE